VEGRKMRRLESKNNPNCKTDLFQPTFLVLVLIDVWRITAFFRRAVNPHIALFAVSLSTAGMVQTCLTAVCSTVNMMC
jgi:hypothetical protein